MKSSLFKDYAQAQAAYRKAEAKRTELREQIIKELKEEGVEKTETSYGIFTRAVKITYEYPEAIMKREENLKIAKKKAEEKGTANVKKETEYLRFSEPKNE